MNSMKIEQVIGTTLNKYGFLKKGRYVFKREGSVIVKLQVYSSRYGPGVYVDIAVVVGEMSKEYKPSLAYDAVVRLASLYPESDQFIKADLSEAECEQFSEFLEGVAPRLEELFRVRGLTNLVSDKAWVKAAGFRHKVLTLEASSVT